MAIDERELPFRRRPSTPIRLFLIVNGVGIGVGVLLTMLAGALPEGSPERAQLQAGTDAWMLFGIAGLVPVSLVATIVWAFRNQRAMEARDAAPAADPAPISADHRDRGTD